MIAPSLLRDRLTEIGKCNQGDTSLEFILTSSSALWGKGHLLCSSWLPVKYAFEAVKTYYPAGKRCSPNKKTNFPRADLKFIKKNRWF